MHIYLDESGDTGFKFSAGSSAYFISALVLVPDPAAAQDAVRALRDRLREPEDYELKFARMPHHLRLSVLGGLRGLGITARVLVVDKRRLVEPSVRQRDGFYKYLMQTAFEQDAPEIRAARLVIDQSFRGKAKQADLATHLQRGLNTGADAKRIAKVTYRESHREQLLQIADVLAGAVAQA